MYAGNNAHYFSVGADAVKCIQRAVRLSGAQVRTILDLPCGHGRVLRAIRNQYPDANITACDIDRDGVDFCAKTFGVSPVYSANSPADISIHSSFDLVWVGSLFTHLESWDDFLEFFSHVLGGVMVFTVAGEFVAETLLKEHGGVGPSGAKSILVDRAATGFGFAPYQEYSDYGRAVVTRQWVERKLAQFPFEIIQYQERGWDNRQDTVTIVPR